MRRQIVLPVIAALTLAMTACGSDDDGDDASPTEATDAPDDADSSSSADDEPSADETVEDATSSGDVGDDESPVRIAFFNPIAANPVTAANYDGVLAEAAEHGADVTAFDAGFDQAKQISQIQDAIASDQYDAFIIMPVNGAALVSVTEEAIAEGIVVVADWNNIGPDLASIEPQVPGLTSVVAQSLGQQGRQIGEEIARGCEEIDPCTAVYMPGSFNQGSEKLRMDEVTAVTDGHPNIEMNTSADGGYQAGPAQAAAADVLLALGDVHVFATPGDQMALGIVQAIEDAGRSGEVKVISAGASERTIQLVRDGVLFSDIVTLPYSEGVYSARHAILAVRGEDVPASLDSITLSPIGPVATAETLGTGAGVDFKGEFPG
jgi:ribose transport system substrate-binding protein